MGKEETRETTVVNQTMTPEATPEETRLNRLEIERQERLFEPTLGLQEQGIDLISQILGGATDLPGFFADIVGGISEQKIGEETTGQLVTQALEDITPQFQAAGILDSGVAASISTREAARVRTGVEEFNINTERSRQAFNIGNLFNLLNLGVGGQAQVQQPILAAQGLLSQRLAGLRPVTTAGTSTQTTQAPNPFLNAFQTSLGQTFGGERL